MASVFLNFTPPEEEGITILRIFEAPAADGPFTPIEDVSDVGMYPNYISFYTTTSADNADDWFSIQWINADGAESETSAAIQGGTNTLAGVLLQRMLLRDPSLSENIAFQEAEAVISDYYGVLDPNTVDPNTVSPKILSGLTNYALMRTYIAQTIISSQNTGSKWSAGIVALDNSKSSSISAQSLKDMLWLVNRDLGLNYSVILSLKEIKVAGGFCQITGFDVTRGILMVNVD